MAIDKVPITVRGFAAMEEELKHRQQVERPRIVAAISEARAHGDLSENAEYHAAKEAQSHNEGRVLELESLIARAEIIDVTKLSGDKIKFGATVKLVDDGEVTYGLSIAEGIENSLAALCSGWSPVWACTSAGAMKNALRRLLGDCGLHREPRDVTLPLNEYLASRGRSAA